MSHPIRLVANTTITAAFDSQLTDDMIVWVLGTFLSQSGSSSEATRRAEFILRLAKSEASLISQVSGGTDGVPSGSDDDVEMGGIPGGSEDDVEMGGIPSGSADTQQW